MSGNPSLEGFVGGGDDPRIRRYLFDTAESVDHSVLEDCQKLGLELEGEKTHLVQEERFTLGEFEEALLVDLGVGEGTLLVTEELCLDKVFGNRGAVDGNKRSIWRAPRR